MNDPELERLELAERTARELFERVSRSGAWANSPNVVATAKELWVEAAAAVEAYKASRS